jgi:hypothetical protein
LVRAADQQASRDHARQMGRGADDHGVRLGASGSD